MSNNSILHKKIAILNSNMREKAWPARLKLELWKGQLKKLYPQITASVSCSHTFLKKKIFGPALDLVK